MQAPAAAWTAHLYLCSTCGYHCFIEQSALRQAMADGNLSEEEAARFWKEDSGIECLGCAADGHPLPGERLQPASRDDETFMEASVRAAREYHPTDLAARESFAAGYLRRLLEGERTTPPLYAYIGQIGAQRFIEACDECDRRIQTWLSLAHTVGAV